MVSPQRAPPVPRRSFEGAPPAANIAPIHDIAPVTAFETGTNEWRRLPIGPVACPSGCGVGMTPLYLECEWILRWKHLRRPSGSVRRICQRSSKPVTYRLVPTALFRRRAQVGAAG